MAPSDKAARRAPKEFYTLKTLGSLAGASTGVWIACGVVAYVFQFNPRWLGLVLALLVAFIVLPQLESQWRWTAPFVLLGLFNGCLVYNQAVGFNTINHAFTLGQASRLALLPVVDPLPWWPSSDLAAVGEELALVSVQLKGLVEEQEKTRGELTALKAQVARAVEVSQEAARTAARAGGGPALASETKSAATAVQGIATAVSSIERTHSAGSATAAAVQGRAIKVCIKVLGTRKC